MGVNPCICACVNLNKLMVARISQPISTKLAHTLVLCSPYSYMVVKDQRNCVNCRARLHLIHLAMNKQCKLSFIILYDVYS